MRGRRVRRSEFFSTLLAVILLGGLVNIRRSAWTFGGTPAEVSDERAIAAWAEIGLRIIEAADINAKGWYRHRGLCPDGA